MDTEREYQLIRKIATYEVGEKSTLKLSSFLSLCQEISELHLGEWGLPYETMKARGLVFLFTQTRAKFYRMPEHREEIELITRPNGSVGVQFYREFEMRNHKTGELLAKATQTSVAADAVSHKILRPKAFLEFGADPGVHDGNRLEKVVLPEHMEAVGERPVFYSDLDYNGHLNNAVYADILCDYLPGGMMGRNIAEFQIHYIMESKYGETLRLYAGEKNGYQYFSGDNDRGHSFECQVRLI